MSKMTADEALLLLTWAEQDRDNYKAEVERLRRELEEAKQPVRQVYEALSEARREVERLRELVALNGKRVLELLEENKRLRKRFDRLVAHHRMAHGDELPVDDALAEEVTPIQTDP
jgi:chromosome segregation ATPase